MHISLVLNKAKWKVYLRGSKSAEISFEIARTALQDCEQDERTGILTLADKLRNISFVQGCILIGYKQL
jgi:hypothetical protein